MPKVSLNKNPFLAQHEDLVDETQAFLSENKRRFKHEFNQIVAMMIFVAILLHFNDN